MQPVHRVHLDAAHKDFPMQVRAGHAPGASHQADYLACLDMVAGMDEDLRLVQISCIDPPAMINDGGIAAHGERSSKDHRARGWGVDLGAHTPTEIQAAVKISIGATVIRAAAAI